MDRARSRGGRIGASGCSAAWIAHLTGGQGVAGSNPASPTGYDASAHVYSGFLPRRRPSPDRWQSIRGTVGVSSRSAPRRPTNGRNRFPCGPRPAEDSPARRSRGCRPSPGPAVCAAGRAGPGRPEPRRTCRGSLARRIPSARLPPLTARRALTRPAWGRERLVSGSTAVHCCISNHLVAMCRLPRLRTIEFTAQ